MRLGALMRVITLGALIACALAVIVARSAPTRGVFHHRGGLHHAAFDEIHFSMSGFRARVLDTQTGEMSPLVLPQAQGLQKASFSDRVNEQGEREVVGRWVRYTGKGPSREMDATGVARFAYPSGRVLDQVPLDFVPSSPPCWFSGDPPRVLLAGTDGRLYRVSFRDHIGQGGADDCEVQPIDWPQRPEGLRESHIGHPVWHKDLRLGNTLIATVGNAPSQEHANGLKRRGYRFQLWWLRLDASGSQIVGGGRLFADNPNHDDQEGFPSVASLPDGGLVLTFVRQAPATNVGDVYAVRLEIDDQTGTPVAHWSNARKVAEKCALVPAAFSPDGRWVFTLKGSPGESARLARRDLLPLLAASSLPSASDSPQLASTAARPLRGH